MKMLWIEFAPFFLPFHRRMEAFAAFFYLNMWLSMGLTSACFIMWAILYSSFFRFPCIAYLIWWYHDRKSPLTGKRLSSSVKNWNLWKLLQKYFPVSLVKTADLSADKSYLLVACPHGIISAGAYTGLVTNGCSSMEKFPELTIFFATIPYLINFPVIREIGLLTGGVLSSEKTMVNILSEKGNALVVAVGGTAEAFLANPGRHRTVIGRRKGFIRVAFKAGASLVPTYVFGENEIYNQIEFKPGSLMKWIQDKVKEKTGSGIVFGNGRGVFQYTFGLMPRRHPLYTVVGKPIEVPKVENPSKEQIDEMHKVFCQQLKELFDREKSNYLKDCENIHLEFV